MISAEDVTLSDMKDKRIEGENWKEDVRKSRGKAMFGKYAEIDVKNQRGVWNPSCSL